MKRLLIAAAAASIIILGSCSKGAAKAADPADPGQTAFAVATATAQKGRISDYLAESGDIIPASSVDAYPDIAGKVTRILVDLGSRVRRDQALVEVDPSRPGMSYVPSQVKSPIAGMVVSIPVEVGGTVAPGVSVARIASTDSLELRCYVAERFVSKMRLGLPAELSLEAYPGRAFRAVVRELSPVLDPVSRTLEVKLAVADAGGVLKSGMFAKVKIYTEERSGVVVVPQEAVVRRLGESFAFVVVDDPSKPGSAIVRKRSVESGLLVDDHLEVIDGLAPGDQVVVRGQTLLDDGAKVNVVSRDGQAAAAK
ncbi:MAG TPA: efflux RND transporter periplasmic adaptor subunit [Rectinemataceae bacterium]|nr:efflux RND transporter periplasmic adaptor subunit [Rectinemataceae bacterium]